MSCKRNFLVFLFFLGVLGLNYCVVGDNSEPEGYLDCNNLKNGILNLNNPVVISEINKLAHNLTSKINDSDSMNQKKNLDLLISRINKQCNGVKASLSCYACIETNPPQSEILIEVDSLNTKLERIIDISTPEIGKLRCLAVRKY